MEEPKKNNREHLKQYYWKPGQSGNPAGRPKGKSLKDYVKNYLACMSEEERQEFLEGLPKEIIWRMAEGNPQSDVTSGGDKIVIPIFGGLSTQKENGGLSTSNSNNENIQP